jgi:hypothetical protein
MTEMSKARVSLAILVAAATAALGAGCGSSSNTMSPTDWANGVCGALVTWKSDITAIGNNLKAGTPTKATLQDAANQVEKDTQTLADSLKSLGKPNTQSGAQAQDAVNQLHSQITDGKAAIESATKGVSTVSGALAAVSSVSGTLSTMATQISSTVTKLEQLDPGGELQKAFSNASSCKKLKTG